MFRFLTLFLLAFTLAAQKPAPGPAVLDKPPQDVDDALRARIKQFYDYHVATKYRQAEQLIADDSKDDFYILSKPDIRSYKIGSIEYSDHFTKAKAIIIGAMPVLLPMAGGKIMDIPFASYWKVIDGQWFWYYNKEAARHTPFGDTKAQGGANGPKPNALPEMPKISIAALQSALKIDRTRVELSGSTPATLKVTNTLPGLATLSISCPNKPLAETGITATFDKASLKGDETAVLTLTAGPTARPGILPLQITISPTNQVLNLTVSVAK